MERVIGKQHARLLLKNLVRREGLDEGFGKQPAELAGERLVGIDSVP